MPRMFISSDIPLVGERNSYNFELQFNILSDERVQSQHLHSPAHPQFASYPRDPMVKAEDDPLPQLLPPQNYVDDKRRPSYPPQTPLSHNQPYDYQPAYGPPHGQLTYPIQIASSSQKPKASQARV
ncbi:hypothetical protein B0T19DRAFT_460021 [Cercophora scortea]|uniref:Uncharacterized protein n=1 Tax=Cercophora scortea TaxID=314031 RepID=A0AAE0IL17_9PEZI|nr:hypothetical protein B0T19DRAFT_460021 [Cercophora scortea]